MLSKNKKDKIIAYHLDVTSACLDMAALDMGSSTASTAHYGVQLVKLVEPEVPVEPDEPADDLGKRKAKSKRQKTSASS